ncbi:MAG TPA: NAD(P)/FAD-dependent oxidoreductase [Steroidobacteraceae bacterium]|nr:NAD(P)/FAD-dependent oxidoreductase [Steroidobacteraceae bacterium]
MRAGRRVLVVGAGPTGLITAFGLAKAGAEVTVIDREPDVVASPRATVYLPSTLKVLDELGLLEEVLREAATGYILQVRFKLTGFIGEIDHRLVSDLTPYGYTLHLGQHELARLIMRRFVALPHSQVRWHTTFEDLQQRGDVVSVRVATPTGSESLEFDWVIGTDGARSSVRRAMGASFEGFTWPETFMATNVYYDFEDFGYAYSNMAADAANWVVVARLDSQEHYWRVSYGESSDLTEGERVARIPERYRYFMPEGRRWELDRANSYRVHQRSASQYRVGRVMLAGDAAHATNPIGGMGLTSGIQDASTLIECLSAVIAGAEGGALDWYAYERRRCFLEVANPTAIEFKRRAQEADPARRLEDEANFRAMQENREITRAGLMAIFALCSRPYRPDWRETLVPEDRSRGAAGETLILSGHAAHTVTRDIE